MPLAPRTASPMMASPMKVMASTAPAVKVMPTKAIPTRAMGMPTIMKSSSDQVRRVNGVSMMVRATSSNRELGSDLQVITMPDCAEGADKGDPATFRAGGIAPSSASHLSSRIQDRENWRSPECGQPDLSGGDSPRLNQSAPGGTGSPGGHRPHPPAESSTAGWALSQAFALAAEARDSHASSMTSAQLLSGQLADPTGPDQDRGVPVEVGRGEERCLPVLDEGQLVHFARNPQHDHIRVALTGFGIGGVGSGVSEEDEGSAAHLVDGIATGSIDHGDLRHPHGQVVDVPDPGLAVPSRHPPSLAPVRPEPARSALLTSNTYPPGVNYIHVVRHPGMPSQAPALVISTIDRYRVQLMDTNEYPLDTGDALGRRIHAYRLAHGMTQRELADQLGVTQQSVARWEQGSPPRRYMVRVLESLLVDADGGEDPAGLADIIGIRAPAGGVPARASGMRERPMCRVASNCSSEANACPTGCCCCWPTSSAGGTATAELVRRSVRGRSGTGQDRYEAMTDVP